MAKSKTPTGFIKIGKTLNVTKRIMTHYWHGNFSWLRDQNLIFSVEHIMKISTFQKNDFFSENVNGEKDTNRRTLQHQCHIFPQSWI